MSSVTRNSNAKKITAVQILQNKKQSHGQWTAYIFTYLPQYDAIMDGIFAPVVHQTKTSFCQYKLM